MKIDSNSLELIKVKGIPIRIHWSFLLILGYVSYINYQSGSKPTEMLWSLIYVLSIFLCVTLHELGHALAAKHYGIETKSITLYPIGGVAALEKIPEKPLQELVVAFSGPLVNVIISVVLWTWIFLSPSEYYLEDIGIKISAKNIIINLATVNLTLVIFNLLPAFPMDGGRVLRALLSMVISRLKATFIAMIIGQLISVIFIISGFIYNPFLIFIGIFIFFGAAQEYQMIKYGNFITNLKVKDALMTQFSLLLPNSTLQDVMKIILDTHEKEFVVINHEGVPIGIMTREILIKYLTELPKEALIRECYQKSSLYLTPETPLNEAFKIMQLESIPIVPVIHKGKLIGVINSENILETIMLHEAINTKAT